MTSTKTVNQTIFADITAASGPDFLLRALVPVVGPIRPAGESCECNSLGCLHLVVTFFEYHSYHVLGYSPCRGLLRRLVLGVGAEVIFAPTRMRFYIDTFIRPLTSSFRFHAAPNARC